MYTRFTMASTMERKSSIATAREGLSREQIEQFKEAFRLFDKDGSGSIDMEELGVVMKSLGQDLSEEEVVHMMEDADLNGDGLMDFEEFLVMMKGRMTSTSEVEDWTEGFKVFDKNGDGFITAKELYQVLRSVGEQNITMHDVSLCSHYSLYLHLLHHSISLFMYLNFVLRFTR